MTCRFDCFELFVERIFFAAVADSFELHCQSKAIDALVLDAIYTMRSDKTIVTHMTR